MVSEFFLNIIFGIVNGMMSLLPDITWTVDSTAFDIVLGVFKVVGYLLPWGTVVAIIGLVLAFTIFRIVISIIKSVWDLLPLV